MVKVEVHSKDNEIFDATKAYYNVENGVAVLYIETGDHPLDGAYISITSNNVQKSVIITNNHFIADKKYVRMYEGLYTSHKEK